MRDIGFLLIWFLLISCSADEHNVVIKQNPLEGLPDKGRISFDNPAIGQPSYYVYFKANHDNSTTDVTFEYSTDTVVLAITNKLGENWVVKEFLTEGSQSRSPSGQGAWGGVADSVFVRHLQIDADSIYFTRPPKSDFFSFAFPLSLNEKRSFQLSLISDAVPRNPKCLPVFEYGSIQWMQYAQDYTQLGQTFDRLNIHFDYQDMLSDGFGFMYAYAPAYGIVRWTWVSYWNLDKAEGWDLVPSN